MKRVPHEFVVDTLLDALGDGPDGVRVKPMFGAYGLYVGERIVFILREKPDPGDRDNGVWLATTPQYHASLAREFDIMRSIEMFGPGPTGWQNLPSSEPEFEESVLRACDLVIARDERIGKIPAAKRLRRTSKKVKKAKPEKTSTRKTSSRKKTTRKTATRKKKK